MRKPRNLDRYSPVLDSIKGLEQLCADLRHKAVEGDLMRWDINMWFWNPAWETKAKTPKSRSGGK